MALGFHVRRIGIWNWFGNCPLITASVLIDQCAFLLFGKIVVRDLGFAEKSLFVEDLGMGVFNCFSSSWKNKKDKVSDFQMNFEFFFLG